MVKSANVSPTQPSTTSRPIWDIVNRGFDLQNPGPQPGETNEDEINYQNAFKDHKPAIPPFRVPEPRLYPNSPSAQEYLRRRKLFMDSLGEPIDREKANVCAVAPFIDRFSRERQESQNLSVERRPTMTQRPSQAGPSEEAPINIPPISNPPAGREKPNVLEPPTAPPGPAEKVPFDWKIPR